MERHASRGHAGNISSTAVPGTAGVDPAEFAEYLRAERERRRLTLDQVADETKIASRHLAALERGDVRNWPGGMYRRAMMRAYAESIGVDREFALKQFEQAFDAPPSQTHVPAPVPEAPRHVERWRPSRRQVLATGASILLMLATFIVWNVAGGLTSSEGDIAGTEAAPPVASPTSPRPATVPQDVVQARPAVAAATVRRETAPTSGFTESRPVATEGTLMVTSDPQGARVTVNGIGWGETPVTIRHLEFGAKRIRLTMQGYISQERMVGLGPERPNGTARLTLRERR
jgi:cytoskeletal protein RodZ